MTTCRTSAIPQNNIEALLSTFSPVPSTIRLSSPSPFSSFCTFVSSVLPLPPTPKSPLDSLLLPTPSLASSSPSTPHLLRSLIPFSLSHLHFYRSTLSLYPFSFHLSVASMPPSSSPSSLKTPLPSLSPSPLTSSLSSFLQILQPSCLFPPRRGKFIYVN